MFLALAVQPLVLCAVTSVVELFAGGTWAPCLPTGAGTAARRQSEAAGVSDTVMKGASGT